MSKYINSCASKNKAVNLDFTI